MKLKSFYFLAAIAALSFTSCSDDEKEEVVGIVAGTITPAESTVAYKLAPLTEGVLDNKDDSIAWDVTDAAMQEAVPKLTPTLNATASVGGVEVTESGVTVDATKPVSVQVTNGSKIVTYTVNVYRAKTAVEGLTKKAALPATNVVWRDFTYFKGKFYAFTVTNKITDQTTGAAEEAYVLHRSTDGIVWTDVDYKVTNADKEVIGGEGARLVPFNNKLYVLLGQRVLGTDKFGNAPDVEDGWMGPSPTIPVWRAFVSDDGENFKSLEADSKGSFNGETNPISNTWNSPYANAFVFNGAMYVYGGYMYGFGMQQMNRVLMKSTDGLTWERINPLDEIGAGFVIPNDGAFFTLGNKLFLIGGYRNFIGADYVSNIVYSTTDGSTWKMEGTLAEGMPLLYQAKAFSNGSVVYLFGGEIIDAEDTRTINNKMYRSEDGITWTEVAVPASFAGTRFPSAVVVGDVAWLFDGDNSISQGYWPAPQATDTYPGNIWNMPMK